MSLYSIHLIFIMDWNDITFKWFFNFKRTVQGSNMISLTHLSGCSLVVGSLG